MLPALVLDQRQRDFLKNTTVDGAWTHLLNMTEIIRNATEFAVSHSGSKMFNPPISRLEAKWALSVLLRRGLTVHPHQDERGEKLARMMLIPDTTLLDTEWYPDLSMAITFQEEIVLQDRREVEVVQQIARRDIPKGQQVYQWAGRFSNSELMLRHGVTIICEHVFDWFRCVFDFKSYIFD
jgi:hypothetical protein